jgi:hypothetical protein
MLLWKFIGDRSLEESLDNELSCMYCIADINKGNDIVRRIANIFIPLG